MALAFLSSATGNPINLKRRIAPQTTLGIPVGDGEAASGTLTFTGATSDEETVTIGTRVYEFDTDSSITAGRVAVDISGGATAPASVTALVAAINADSSAVVYAFDGTGDTVVVFAKTPGTAGNSLAKATNAANAAWDAGGGGTTLAGGTADTYVDFRSNGGPIILTANEIPREVVSPDAAPLASLLGKVEIGQGPLAMGDLDPANRGQIRLLANAFGKYTLTDNSTWYKYEFALNASTSASGYLTLLNDNDIHPRTRFADGLVGGFSVSASPGSNLSLTVPIAFGGYDFHGIPVQTAGNTAASTTVPLLRKTWTGNWAADGTDKDIYVRFDTDNTTTWVVSVKVGAAASYSSTTTITEGAWSRLNDENGDPIWFGGVGEQVQIYIPTSAVVAVGDIFKFPNRRAAWTPSYTTERPLSSVNTVFWLDGEEIRVEGGWSVDAAWEDFSLLQDTAGRQGATPERAGEFNVRINIDRRIRDLLLQKGLHEGQTFNLAIDCQSAVEIGSTGKYFRALMVAPAAKAFGPMFGTQPGGRNRNEAVGFQCSVPAAAYSFESVNYASHFHLVLQNDQSAL